jgi:hypothetical protein
MADFTVQSADLESSSVLSGDVFKGPHVGWHDDEILWNGDSSDYRLEKDISRGSAGEELV